MKIHLLFTLITVISLFIISSVGSSYAENSVNVEEEKMIALIGTDIDPDDDNCLLLGTD